MEDLPIHARGADGRCRTIMPDDAEYPDLRVQVDYVIAEMERAHREMEEKLASGQRRLPPLGPQR